jgi:energy-coupling factor transporter ATP-binding protein EcfA2
MSYTRLFDPKTLPSTGTGLIADQSDGAGYVFNDPIVHAVNAALATGRPLLVRGDSGTGKSSLAAAIAAQLDSPMVRWRKLDRVISSRTEARDLLWEVDHLRRLQDAHTIGTVLGEPGDYRNRGTTEPWVDFRFDQELPRSEGRSQRITYAAGVAGSDGIVHTGIGPFNLERGSANGYFRTSYRRDRLNLMLHASALRVKGPDLLAFDVNEDPLRLSARTRTLGLELSDSHLLGGKHILTYGGSLRLDAYKVNLAPAAKDRTGLGAFVQDELFFGWGDGPRRELRLVLGARLDKSGNIAGPVFSPRLSCIWKPGPDHALLGLAPSGDRRTGRIVRAPRPGSGARSRYSRDRRRPRPSCELRGADGVSHAQRNSPFPNCLKRDAPMMSDGGR